MKKYKNELDEFVYKLIRDYETVESHNIFFYSDSTKWSKALNVLAEKVKEYKSRYEELKNARCSDTLKT